MSSSDLCSDGRDLQLREAEVKRELAARPLESRSRLAGRGR